MRLNGSRRVGAALFALWLTGVGGAVAQSNLPPGSIPLELRLGRPRGAGRAHRSSRGRITPRQRPDRGTAESESPTRGAVQALSRGRRVSPERRQAIGQRRGAAAGRAFGAASGRQTAQGRRLRSRARSERPRRAEGDRLDGPERAARRAARNRAADPARRRAEAGRSRLRRSSPAASTSRTGPRSSSTRRSRPTRRGNMPTPRRN